MNKSELIDRISNMTNFTKCDSEKLLDATLEVIRQTVSSGEDVKLVGFGTFSRLARKPRSARNPKTGSEVKIPAAIVPKFRPGKDFKEAMR